MLWKFQRTLFRVEKHISSQPLKQQEDGKKSFSDTQDLKQYCFPCAFSPEARRTPCPRGGGQEELPHVRGQGQRPRMPGCNGAGISELKWIGMGEFNSDDHYIYYCRQESLRRNGVAIMVNKRVRNAVLGCSLKNDRMISVSKANHTISQ